MSLTHPTHCSLKLMYQQCMFLGRERVKICLQNLHTKNPTFTVLASCFFVQTNQNHEHFLFLFALFCVCKSHFDKSQTNRKHCCFTHTQNKVRVKACKRSDRLKICKKGRNACKTRQICQNILCQFLSSLNNMCNV